METAPKTPLDGWMTANGKTDEMLAADLTITRSQVNRLRNGVSNPSISTAAALSRLTGLSIEQLIMRPREEGAAA
jgi:transcriptional regulator with XRE-family HTH domain